MYICMNLCNIYVCMSAYIYMCVYVWTHVVWTYVMYVCMDVLMNVGMYVQVYVCMYVCMRAWKYVMYVRMNVCILMSWCLMSSSVTTYRLVNRGRHSAAVYCFIIWIKQSIWSWRWIHYNPLKSRLLFSSWRDVTSYRVRSLGGVVLPSGVKEF